MKLHDDLGHHHEGDDEHGHSHGPRPTGDPEKVIKEIKTALEQHEGCRVRHSLQPVDLPEVQDP